MIDQYVIGPRVLDEIRSHSDGARPGWEVGGELLAEKNRIVTYRPCENLSTEAGFYEPVRPPAEPWFLSHSHPGSRSTAPSDGDLEWARTNGMVRFAVYAPNADHDRLTVWHLWEAEGTAPRAVPVVVEPRSFPRLPPRRPGRRW